MHLQYRGFGALVASVAALLASSGLAESAQNVARGSLAISSNLLPCTAGSGPENAVDGAATNIYTDKWCVPSGKPTLTLPVAAYGYTVSSIVVKHAGVAENAVYNTRAFRLLVTQGLSAPVTVATVTANTASQTTHPVNNLANVTVVQLAIDTPTQGANQATRIYEVEVYGEPTPPPVEIPFSGGTGVNWSTCMYYYVAYDYCCYYAADAPRDICYLFLPSP